MAYWKQIMCSPWSANLEHFAGFAVNCRWATSTTSNDFSRHICLPSDSFTF